MTAATVPKPQRCARRPATKAGPATSAANQST
nr:MAG TPA: hypothetical protein [Caudoviricetes sp.]